MRNTIITISLSILFLSCNNSKNSYEIGFSQLGFITKTGKGCNFDYYESVLIKNDSILVYGKHKYKWGNYVGILNNNELINLNNLIKRIKPKYRKEKETNATCNLTALIIKENGKTIDSLIPNNIAWSKADLKLFDYIEQLICEKDFKGINDSIKYMSWEMIKLPN